MRDVFDDMFDAVLGRSFPFSIDAGNDKVSIEKRYSIPAFPRCKVTEGKDGTWKFVFELPGYKKEDLAIDFEKSSLIVGTISSYKEEVDGPDEIKKEWASNIEHPAFRYAYSIPIVKLNTEKTSATFKDAILTIVIPPLEEEAKKKKVIEIK